MTKPDAADPMNYKGMWLAAVSTLAAIDALLGLQENGCNDPDVTLSALRGYMAPAAPATPNASLPPLGEGPRMKIHVTVEVPENWAQRLDMQWVLEREIHADRWSWDWPTPAAPVKPPPDERTPFDVLHGPRTVHGQIATGFVVGVRMPDLDVLVFGATVDETRRAAELLGGTLFGEAMIERRAMLVRESQSS
jgi:hypothetical protein